jgi:hypothetical protein
MTLARLLLAASLAALTGCAGAPHYLAQPPAHDAVYRLGRSAPLEFEAHTVVFLDDARRTRFVQNFGGGGAAVGVMFGPFGVAANAAAIKSTTKEDSALLRGKLGVDVLREFEAAALAAGFGADAMAEAAPLAAPYFEIVRIDDQRFALGVALVVELGAQRGNWRGVYNLQLDTLLMRADIAAPLDQARSAALAAELRQGYAGVIALARADANGSLPSGGDEVSFRSSYLTPRFEFELPALRLEARDGRVLLRTSNAVVSLPLDQVEIVAKPKRAAGRPASAGAARP